MKHIFLLFFIIFTITWSKTIQIDSHDTNFEEFDVEYFIDKTNKSPFSEVKEQKFLLSKNKKTFGNESLNIWFKINISNNTNKLQIFYLYNMIAFKSSFIQFYELENDKILNNTKYNLFDNIGDKNLMKGSKSEYKVILKPNSTKTLYMQNVNKGHNYVELLLFNETTAQNKISYDVILIALPIGFLISLIIYNLILFQVLKYSEYLYYLLYLASATAWMAYSYGIVSEVFHIYDITAISLMHGIMILPLFLALFIRSIFRTNEKYKFENWLLNSLIVVSILLNLYAIYDIFAAIKILTFVSKYTLLVLTVVGVMIYYKGETSMRYFLIGHTFFVLFAAIAVLFYEGSLDYNYFTSHSLGIGILLEAILLAYLLTHRIRLLENAKIDLLDNLEQKVSQRTNKLNETITDLKSTQKQLVESEKLSSLATLVAGVAHEVNTPIGIGLTGSTHLMSITKDIKKKYEENSMSKSAFVNYLDKAYESANIITSNLNRAGDLIKDFKQVAVDQSSEEKRTFIVDEYINKIIVSMHSVIKKTNIKIDVICKEEVKIYSYPGLFSQVITNLIMNSVNHAFEESEKGTIQIEVDIRDSRLYLIYRDDGKGISQENIKKIYDPFFTTNRENGGSGLGMNIIYNIITSKLEGNIDCKSKLDEYTVFTMSFEMNKIKKVI